MQKKIFTLFLALILGLLFFLPFQKVQAKIELDMGMRCYTNDMCKSGDCEDGFCDCYNDESCAKVYGGKEEDWECRDENDISKELDFCVNRNDPKDIRYPRPDTEWDPSLIGSMFNPEDAAKSLGENLADVIKKPDPKIEIPGLEFSDINIDELTSTDENNFTWLHIPFLGEYLLGIYKYIIIIATLIATVNLIISGVQWMMGGATKDGKTGALSRIRNSIMGLTLALCSYLLLFSINPEMVRFRSLKILYIPRIPYEPNYVESPEEGYEDTIIPEEWRHLFEGGSAGQSGTTAGTGAPLVFGGGNSSLPSTGRGGGCLMDTFAPGYDIGSKLSKSEKVSVNMFGIMDVTINKRAKEAYEKVSQDILASTDPEVEGFLRWMKDFKEKKMYDMLGKKDGKGVFSFNMRSIGWKTDAHAMGIAVDIMTRSNWDIYLPAYAEEKKRKGKKIRGKPQSSWCPNYKKTFAKMKAEFPSDPYKMYERLEVKYKDCSTFANGTIPPTTIPDGMIQIFEKNGFYWGGWGWTKPGNPIVRTDPMHFQYMGPCK